LVILTTKPPVVPNCAGFFLFQKIKKPERKLGLSELAWRDGFRTFDWKKAFPVPEIALEEISGLLALTKP